MFLNNKIYKHINCRDVAFFVLTYTDSRDGAELIGYWVNVYYKPASIILAEDGPVQITIKPEHIEKWEIYEE